MRRFGLCLALVCTGLAPLPAAAQVRVGILAVELEGEVPAHVATRTEESVTAGLAGRGFEVTGTRPLAESLGSGGDVAHCTGAPCLTRLSEGTGIHAALRVAVRGELNIYAFRLEALTLAGNSLAAVEGGCDICNFGELGTALEEASRRLADELPRRSAVVLSGAPEGAVVEVDGERVPLGPMTLPPGPRLVMVRAPGHEVVTRRLVVRLGEPLTVDLGRGDDAEPPRSDARTERRRARAEPGRSRVHDWRAMRTSGWVLVGGGGAAIVGGVVNMAIHHACAGGDRNSAGECERHFETLWLGLGIGSAGLAVAATGFALLLLSRRVERERGDLAGRLWLSGGPGGTAGAGFGLTF